MTDFSAAAPVIALDVILVVMLLVQMVNGWRRGLVTGLFGVFGIVMGGAVALWSMPQMLAMSPALEANPTARSIIFVAVLLFVVGLAHQLFASTGEQIVANHKDGTIGQLDAFGGSVVSVGMTALSMALVSLAIYPSVPASWRTTMSQSTVLSNLTRYTPPAVVDGASTVTRVLYEQTFPKVFGDGAEPDLPTEAPNDQAAETSPVRQAAASVVRINAAMASCNRSASGSGWVVANQRIVTNAHVVAGASTVTVQPKGTGPGLKATVVAFDPDRDLAVLAVPNLRSPALERTGSIGTGSDVVVAGFPLGGPYRAEAARVRGTVEASGHNIYDQPGVNRQVYSLRGTVQPGNSGGPLLTPDGKVAGTIFAKSRTSSNTGFALTDATSDSLLDRADKLSKPVSTQQCSE